MLDIKFVRENPEVVKQNIRNKFQDSKQAETCLGDWIEAFILEHYAFSSSNFFMNATRASTPSFGIAL